MSTLRANGCAIYVLIDALGWELLKDRPFLDDIFVERHRLQTVLGYSSAAIPSILSGRYPDEHGHWNLFYLSPETSPFRWARLLRPLPKPLVENRLTRKLVKEISRRLSGYTGYFSIYDYPVSRLPFFDLCERRDIYQPGGIESCPSLFDILTREGIRFECFTYHRYSDGAIFDAVTEQLQQSPAQVYFIYLCELDAYLHFHIGDTDGVAARLQWYEARLRRLYRAVVQRWGGDVRFFVFSDHGMTPVKQTYDLARDVEGLGLSVPDDFLPAYDSTMARFWIWNERAHERLTGLLANHPCGRILPEDELRKFHIFFEDGRYSHLVFLMHPGITITPSDMGQVRFGGMHGFHPSEPTSDAVLFSSVPLPSWPDHITGIHRLILDDLSISTSGEIS